jgi:hypothetical protein
MHSSEETLHDFTPPPPPPAASPSTSHAYEFSDEDNVVIQVLASRMNFVGLFALGVGIFVIFLGALFFHIASILSGSLYAVIGIWTHRAGHSFHNITATRGNDLRHLMHAIRDLQRLYTIQFWLCLLTLMSAVITSVLLMLNIGR